MFVVLVSLNHWAFGLPVCLWGEMPVGNVSCPEWIWNHVCSACQFESLDIWSTSNMGMVVKRETTSV